jgi:glycosyltransferase involved in cell wall biosynthesis
MKIAMLGHKRIPSREGGIEIVIEELASRMVDSGNNVTVYNRRGHHVSDSSYDINDNIKIYKGINIKSVITINRKGLAAISSSFFATCKVSFSNYDLIHFHAEGPCSMLWISHLFNKKTVVTIHGLDWQRAKWKEGIGSKIIKFGERQAVKYADEIIVLSKEVHNYFLTTYNRQTNFIPNGVNKPNIIQANEIKEKFQLDKDEYILFLGRLVPEKGIHYLIDAYSNLNTNKKLVIAGGTSDTDEYMKKLKTKSKKNKNIVFTGFVQGKILEELYSNAYIYVLPSELEGMPLSLLEAMSYGNCCLTSDIKECTEVYEDKAISFINKNVNDLQKKLLYLLNNREIVNSYKKDASDFICNKYNWGDITQSTLKIYSKVIGK